MPSCQVSRKVVTRVAVVVASFLVLSNAVPANAESASADDTARFLAGMQPSAGSPLLPLTRDAAWQQHARRFNSIFESVESRQLAKIRAWSSAKITNPQPVLFYMFSGPDFLYANAFFPKQSTYVLAGLEPTGPIPDLMKLPRGSVGQGLRNIEVSLQSILSNSFFKTNDMRDTLRDGPSRARYQFCTSSWPVRAKRFATHPSSSSTSRVWSSRTTDRAWRPPWEMSLTA